MTHYLKWTSRGRVPSYQGGTPIPYRRWTDPVPNPVLCVRGWHACRWEDALSHISDELWVADLGGAIATGPVQVAGGQLRLVRKAKLDDTTLRLFAADCAERALPLFEEAYSDDDRPRKAIEAARQFSHGKIASTAWVAASSAARAAAWAAARAAARAAASSAAWDAWAAASSAAEAAAWDVERKWQTDRLLTHHAGLDPDDFAHKGI